MELSKACKQLIITDPFYGLFLLSLSKCYSDNVPTAGVCRNGIDCQLEVNKDFWYSLTDEQQLAILKHELMHICFKHLTMRESFSDFELFNYAADAEVNSYINNLPDGCIDAADFGLDYKMGTKYYYDNLPKNPDFQSKCPQMGNPDNGTGDHSSWKGFDNLSDAEKQLIEQQIDHIAKHTAEQVQKLQGTIPGELASYIGKLFKQKKPVFNWRQYFRRCIGTINDITLKKTRKKESLRFPDSSGIRHKKKTKILVAIDTSGSVSNKELCDFFSEINHIYKAGAIIDIIECDTRITAQYQYSGKFDGKIHGRGGTNFNPPIEYYNQNRKEYTSFVYFTDGYAPIGIRPLKDMIWIITSNGNKQNYPGKTIYIPKENE